MSCEIVVDPQSFGRLKHFSGLSPKQLKDMTGAISMREVEKSARICDPRDEREYVHILLSGAVACKLVDSGCGRHKLLKLISPGVLPMVPERHPTMDLRLKYEAFTNCKVGKIDVDGFFRIMLRTGLDAYRDFVELHVSHWMAVIWRSSKSVLGWAIRDRLGLALLELSSEFGVDESRGTLLRISPSHEDLADLVGTTRARLTQALGELERNGMILRFGRRIVVQPNRIENLLRVRRGSPPYNPAASPYTVRPPRTLTFRQ